MNNIPATGNLGLKTRAKIKLLNYVKQHDKPKYINLIFIFLIFLIGCWFLY